MSSVVLSIVLAISGVAHHHRRHHHWQRGVASWYNDDGGQTASGFHAHYGVAVCGSSGPCYPFGAKIRFCYQRCVTATVDDHGPYVAGRNFDFDEATASATGLMSAGVASVRYYVMR